VARIDTWKGFDILLDAFPTMRARRPDLELVIAGGTVSGKEAYAAGLRQRAAEMAGVHWMGHRNDVGDLLADLDVFVQVSTEPEPFGLVVVEALASGVPVVAGAAGGPLEILGEGPADPDVPPGRLVRPGDAAALAEAVVSLLPPGPSATEERRRRHPLRQPSTGDFASLFDRLAQGRSRPGTGPSRSWLRRGRGPRTRRRTSSRRTR
jgi:glycosyltransferase involved in cell wall biosynthesis